MGEEDRSTEVAEHTEAEEAARAKGVSKNMGDSRDEAHDAASPVVLEGRKQH